MGGDFEFFCQDISYKPKLKKIEKMGFFKNSLLLRSNIAPSLFKLFFDIFICFYTKKNGIPHILESWEYLLSFFPHSSTKLVTEWFCVSNLMLRSCRILWWRIIYKYLSCRYFKRTIKFKKTAYWANNKQTWDVTA